MIRIGRRIYEGGNFTDPEYLGFTKIIVMTKSYKKWWPLSPYCLTDETGRIMENIWQFSKIYSYVPRTIQRWPRSSRIIWNYPEENHVVNGKITNGYFRWRESGMNSDEAIRYPVGYHHRHECLGTIKEKEDRSIDMTKLYNYVDSRKEIYVKEYVRLAKQTNELYELRQKLISGTNLLIIEVDGPHQESIKYYKNKYEVSDNFIEKNTMLVTKNNLEIMLNDDKHPFGHGYCLAMAIYNIDSL